MIEGEICETINVYAEVCFYSTKDRHTNGRPVHLMSASEMFDGQVEAGEEEAFAKMMPIGTLLYEYSDPPDEEHVLALDLDPGAFCQIVELEYVETHGGLIRSDDVYESQDLTELLDKLCDIPEDG